MNNWKSIGGISVGVAACLYYIFKKTKSTNTTEIHDMTLKEEINREQKVEEEIAVVGEKKDDNDITYDDITYISDHEKQILDRVIREVIEEKKKEELEFLAYIVKNALSYC